LFKILIQTFTLELGLVIGDVILDVLIMKEESAINIIGADSPAPIKAPVFRFKQSQDDPTLLFWRPWKLNEWPFIFFLKLEERELLPNKDFGVSV
jgi:hypothetical protein